MADSITIQAQDTTFQRFGNSDQRRGYFLPGGAIITYPLLSSTAFATEIALLTALMGQDPGCIPGGLTLATIQSLVAEAFEGGAELANIYQQDPFGDDYESRTNDIYNRQYLEARSVAMSGPTNVRGGTARMGFELAELDTLQAINRFKEVWQNQVTVAQLVTAAVQTFNTISGARRNTMLQAQQLQAGTEQGRVVQALSAAEQASRLRNDHIRGFTATSEYLGVSQMTVAEDLEGRGFQGGTQTAFGSSYWR